MELFLGIDVGKFALDVYIDALQESFCIKNNQAGLKELIKKTNSYVQDGYNIKLVVCEATGGYEKPLVNVLKLHGIPLHVAHANKVKNFARATGRFAKTDKLDAKILSDYAMVFKVKPNESSISEELSSLKDFQIRRKQLLADLSKEKNRLDKNISKGLIKSINRHIKWLEHELNMLSESIEEFIDEHIDIKERVKLITSIPGVGKTTASIILTDLPEINTISDKQLSCLAGLAPMNRDSGTKNGKRYIKGGRAIVRTSLYMATIALIRCNYLIKEFYQRLRSKGKPAKVAIVAAMHKLLLIIKSVVCRQTKWVDNIRQTF